MLAKNVLANFMSELDLNIFIMLYGLALESLDEAIRKVKMIKMNQRNASETVQYNVKMV